MGKTTETARRYADRLRHRSRRRDRSRPSSPIRWPHPGADLASATTRVVYDHRRLLPHPRERAARAAGRLQRSRGKPTCRIWPPGQHPLPARLRLHRRLRPRRSSARRRPSPGPLGRRRCRQSRPRWVGSGWTIFNNKGKPVRQYEPFFTRDQRIRIRGAGRRQRRWSSTTRPGVSSRCCIPTPPGRRWSSIAWRQETWDRNDTRADRRSAQRRRLSAPYFQPRSARRRVHLVARGADRRQFRRGRRGQSRRAGRGDQGERPTPRPPRSSHFDSLGRTCLQIVDNGGGARFAARTALDTEGKPLAVFDALGRRTQEHVLRVRRGGGLTYVAGCDMGGRPLYQINADAGARRALEQRRRQADPPLGRARAGVSPRLRCRSGAQPGAMSASAARRRSCSS